MKFTVVTLFLALTLNSSSQEISKIFKAIGEGDIQTISHFLSEKVEISINDRTRFVDKSNAEEALEIFYDGIEPLSYEHMHRVDSPRKGTFYTIGKLMTEDRSFRVSIYLVRSQEDIRIKELRFERSKS